MQQGGRPGRHVPPHFLADQLTLSQPGGGTLSPPSTMCPPGFSDLATALIVFLIELDMLLLLRDVISAELICVPTGG